MSAKTVTWAGDNGANVWRVGGSALWNSGTATFQPGDSVIFDDSTNNTAITIDDVVTPGSVSVDSSKNYTFVGSGGISGAADGLTKSGTGTLTLITTNTYIGPTQVNAGTLIVTGSITGSSVTVGSGATIGGAGSISTGNQPFTLASGASLSPGVSIGTLTVDTGTASLDIRNAVAAVGSGALRFQLGDADFSDKIALTAGTLDIGNGLLGFDDFSFSTIFGFEEGTYTLIETADGIVGSLDTNLTGFIGQYVASLAIGENGSDLVLVVVPEPSSAASLIGGFSVLLGGRRCRRLNCQRSTGALQPRPVMLGDMTGRTLSGKPNA